MLEGTEVEKVKGLKQRLDEFKDRLDRSLLFDARELGVSIQMQITQLGTPPSVRIGAFI
jgi:hypothetical protein